LSISTLFIKAFQVFRLGFIEPALGVQRVSASHIDAFALSIACRFGAKMEATQRSLSNAFVMPHI